MATLLDYLEYDEVRAALGISEEELDDTTLELNLNLFGLKAELSQIDASLNSSYLTVLAIAPASRTTAQADLYEAVRVFAVYCVALGLTPGLQNRVPKTITDGKASITRFSDNPDGSVKKQIKENYERFKELLRAAFDVYQGSSGSSVVYSFFSSSSPDVDVVTGE